MTDAPPKGPSRPFSSAGLVFGMPLLAGLVFALAVYGLLVYVEMVERRKTLESESAHALSLVRANMVAVWNRAASYAENAARTLEGADNARIASTLAQYQALWPEAGFSVYDRKGELFSPRRANGPDSAPVPHTARELVHKALVGQTARDLTRQRGFLSLSAASPMRAGEARALLVSVPLDPFALKEMKDLSRADVAVLLFDEVSGGKIADPSSAANTFTQDRNPAAGVWEELGAILAGQVEDARNSQKADTHSLIFLDGGRAAAVAAPLTDAKGDVMGLLVTAPLRAMYLDYTAPWRIAASLSAGFVAALLTAWLLNRRTRRVAEALAGAVTAMSIDQAQARESWKLGEWPPALEEALEKVADVLREYRLRAWNAERARGQAEAGTPERLAAKTARDEEQYQRLFSNAPFGAFQTEADGRFIRVNQMFAYLLGYDAPMALLSEHPSFSEFFLYGDEMRNPLNALLGQRGDRHLVSLRRRDGKVRHFALIFSPITSQDGSRADILEGFLLDRDLDEQLTKAVLERDFAQRQRASLALLLAATCGQFQGFLDYEKGLDTDRPTGDENQDGDEGVVERIQEREKSLRYAKAILGDIFQIAMSEVDSRPPVAVPIEFGRFLSRLCRQLLPGMHARGVSLRCEVAQELLQRMSGPAPLLRHALQRALLTVTEPAHGGWAWLSVVRDPNAPRSPGFSRVLFSASWSSYSRDAGHSAPGVLEFQPTEGEHVVAFDAPADPDAVLPAADQDSGALELGNEQEVIRYLAQRMRGELLEGVFTNDLRSIQLIVPLDNMVAGTETADAEPASGESQPEISGAGHDDQPGHGTASPGEASAATLKVFAPSRTGPGMAGSPAAPIDLFAMAEEPPAVEYPEPGEGGEEGLDILLIDDSLNNRLLFSLFLRDTRHRITETHDGQGGVEAFQRGHFDVVFMDMEMPLMDGYQATRIIRALEADKGLPQTPIVGMTTYALPEFRRQCLLSGCTDFLSKPFSKIALFSLLDAFMLMKKDREQQGKA